jgi:hypothetical protein
VGLGLKNDESLSPERIWEGVSVNAAINGRRIIDGGGTRRYARTANRILLGLVVQRGQIVLGGAGLHVPFRMSGQRGQRGQRNGQGKGRQDF